MSQLGQGLTIVVCSVVVGITSWFLLPTDKVVIPPPLTYDSPIKVLTKSVRPGDPFTTISSRCNNTDHDIAIEATIFWRSADGKTLIPYTTMDGQQVGRVQAIIMPGCRNNYISSFPFPTGLPAGSWHLVGSACYGGLTVEKQVCQGWETEVFEVLP